MCGVIQEPVPQLIAFGVSDYIAIDVAKCSQGNHMTFTCTVTILN